MPTCKARLCWPAAVAVAVVFVLVLSAGCASSGTAAQAPQDSSQGQLSISSALSSYAGGDYGLWQCSVPCHDSEGKQTTVEALPQVIEYFQGLGYTFGAIDRSTWVPHHAVGN